MDSTGVLKSDPTEQSDEGSAVRFTRSQRWRELTFCDPLCAVAEKEWGARMLKGRIKTSQLQDELSYSADRGRRAVNDAKRACEKVG
jgi:hypothetical protein